MMYNSCTGSSSHGPYDPFFQPFNSYDFKLQNGRPSPFCLYSQNGAYFPPNGNCFGYAANEWITYQVRIKTGARTGDEFKGSYVTFWAAREGKPSELVLDWGPYNLTAGSAGENQQYGKIWLTPYHTNKSSSQSHPTAYVWYDELIISRNKIADPDVPTTTSGTVPSPSPSPSPEPSPSPAPAPPGALSYALPSIGQAVAVGTNTALSVRPSGISANSWGYSLFNSFGAGAFVPDYSGAGAYVIAASGGHNVTAVLDAVIFDFTDATWKRLANANGVVPREADYSTSETTGSPYYEVPNSGNVPSGVHLYAIASYIPSSRGGGPKGSYIKVASPAVTVESRQGTGIHRMDLSTGRWSRATNSVIKDMGYSHESVTVFDPVAGRYYFLPDCYIIFNRLEYLDLADMQMKVTPSYPYPSGNDAQAMTAFLDPVRRLIVVTRPGNPLTALDLNNIAAGWVTLNSTGTPPSESNRWAYYEPDGRFYTRTNRSGQTLWRLTPPAGDWKTGTWRFETVTIGGAAMPNYTTTGGNVRHYGNFFYVPYLQSLAWVSGESTSVIIMKPPL